MIAVLGWGSLIWNPQDLQIDKSIGKAGWFPDGPMIPLEFARISSDKRLTLVLLPNTKPIQTLWAVMAVDNINEAIENLRRREGQTRAENIGRIIVNEFSAEVSEQYLNNIRLWAESKNFSAVIWTGLQSNFSEKTESLFNDRLNLSIEHIQSYFKKLNFDEYRNAKAYVINAPNQIQTSFRSELEARFRKGTMFPDKVIKHEAGHILVAKAYGWSVDDLVVGVDGSPLRVKFCKDVGAIKVCGLILNSISKIEIDTNVERLISTQGGWAVDTIFRQSDEGQWEGDMQNYNVIRAEIPSPQPNITEIRYKAQKIITANQSRLKDIAEDIESYIAGLQDIHVFEKDYRLTIPEFSTAL